MTVDPVNLLLVDDDEGDRFLVKQALAEELPALVVAEVSTASDFERALEPSRAFDLAITGGTLGWSDGVSVAETLHHRYPACPIIMFTGTDLLGNARMRRMLLAGMVDIISKGEGGHAELKESVRKALSRRPADAAAVPDRQRFASIVAGVVDYEIFLLDERGRVLTWNEGARRIEGYDAVEIVGAPNSVFFTPDQVAVARPRILLEKARELGHVRDEGWRVRKGGTRFWADVTLSAIRDASGKVVGFCKVTRDISARRAAEQSLRRSEERFRVLVTSVQDYAIFMLDDEGRIISWNKGAEKIKGYRADEVLGKTISIFYPEEDRGKWRRLLDQAARAGRVEDEGWRVRKGGERFWADVVITALKDDSGNLAGYAKVTRDLSQRREAEQEITRRARELEALNRELDLFSSTISHDLKAPIRQIHSFASLLADRKLDERSLEFVGRIQTAASRLQGMTEELLTYSRLTREELPVGKVDLDALVGRVLGGFSSDIESSGAACRIQGPLPAVLANEPALERVATNLVGNALKFTAAGRKPEVTVRGETTDGRLRVLIEDRGIGVAQAQVRDLFVPFKRGHGRDAYPGHGLGLAIVKRTVERMGGALGFSPRAGGGSVFWIELKLAL